MNGKQDEGNMGWFYLGLMIPAMVPVCLVALACAASVYFASTSVGGQSSDSGAMYAAASCACFFLCSSLILVVGRVRCPNGCDNIFTGR